MEIKTVIVDAGFILHALKKGIDFLEEFENKGLKVAVLRESLQSLKELPLKSKSSRMERGPVKQALSLFENRKVEMKTIGRKKIADWLIEKGNEGFFIATRDNFILRQVPRKAYINTDGKIKVFNGDLEI